MAQEEISGPVSPPLTDNLPLGAGASTGFRPLGGANLPDGPALLQSLNGVVTNMVTAQRETQKITKEILTASERTARMMGTVLEQAQTLQFLQGKNAQGGLFGGGLNITPVGAAGSGSFMYGGRGLAAAHDLGTAGPIAGSVPSLPPDTPGVSRDAGAINAASRKEASRRGLREGDASPRPAPEFPFPQSWEEGKRFDLGSLRQGVAQRVNHEVSEWATSGKQYFRAAEDQTINGVVVRKGQFLAAHDRSGASIPGTGSRAAPRGSPEVAAKLVENAAGELIPEVVGNPGARVRMASMAKNFSGSLAQGEGLGGALSGAAPAIGKALGVAGAVYVGANTALNFAENQRSKNMEFQSVLGGSNAEGFGERWRQNVFRLGMRGTMGGSEAEAIYKAAMENYGTNKSSRGNYQSAAVDMFRGGIGSDESIRLLNQAASIGNDNVKMLADSVLSLGKVARAAGESAADARAKFSEAMSGYESMSSGTQQIKLAELEATVRTKMGDRLGQVTYERQNSELGQRVIARNLGVSYADLSASLNSGAQRLNIRGEQMHGSKAYAMGKDELIMGSIKRLDPTGQIQKAILDKARAAGFSDKDNMDIGKIEEIAAAVQMEMPDSMVDPTRLGGGMRSAGLLEVTNNNAMTYFTQGVLSPNPNMRAYEGLDAIPDPSGKNFAGIDLSDLGKMADPDKFGPRGRAAYDFIENQLGYKMGSSSAQGRVAAGRLDLGKGTWGNRRSTSEQFANVLVKSMSAKKGIDPSLYRLYQNRDELKDSRFVVKTKDGGETSVEFGELARYYGDQVQSNPESVRIQGGRYGGETLYQAFGLTSDGSKAWSVDKEAKAGISVEEGQSRASESDKKSGTVEIFLSDEARRLIGVETTGAAREARSTNSMPPSGASTPAEKAGN